MTYREQEKIQEEKRDRFIAAMREAGSYPITQHPSYEQDIAFDIDDIIEYIESKEEKEKEKRKNELRIPREYIYDK